MRPAPPASAPARRALARCLPPCLALAAGCGAQRPLRARPVVTVVLAGGEAQVAPVRRALEASHELPVELHLAELPNVPAAVPSTGDVTTALALARQRYVDADFAACVRATGDDALPGELLGAGLRELAARVLFWRVACHVGAGEPADAARPARQLVVFGLDVPPDVSATTPEVESVLADARRAVEHDPRSPLRVSTDIEPAAVALDGRAAVCAVPCTLDVAPGDHVVRVDADGVLPAVRVVRAEDARAEVRIATTAALPATAAQQWTARYATAPALDSAPSVGLLSRAVAARTLLLLVATGTPRATHLAGVLAADGTPRARAERTAAPGAVAAPTFSLLRELLVRGGVVVQRPLWEDPVFWTVVGLTATGAVALTAALVYTPSVRSEVHF